MSYHSIVCVKQVPDTKNITAEAMKDDGTVNGAALPTIFNPEDLHALETALEIAGPTMVVRYRSDDGSSQGGRRVARLPVSGRRSGDPVDRPPRGGQRYAWRPAISSVRRSARSANTILSSAAASDRRRYGPGRSQGAEKLGLTQVTYLEQVPRLSAACVPDPPEYGPRMGDRRGKTAGAGDRYQTGEPAPCRPPPNG